MFADLVEELIVTDDDALTARLRSNELRIRQLTAEQAAITNEIERRELYHDDGHRSVATFLRANLILSAGQAATSRKIAALLDTVPGAGDALLDGHIGVAQAGELGRLRANPRVGDRLAEFADTLLDAAELLKFADFKIVGQRWESLTDLDGAAAREASNIEHRDAAVIDAGGELFMRASGGSGLEISEMEAVFDSFVEHEFTVDCTQRDAEQGPGAPTSLLARTDKQRSGTDVRIRDDPSLSGCARLTTSRSSAVTPGKPRLRTPAPNAAVTTATNIDRGSPELATAPTTSSALAPTAPKCAPSANAAVPNEFEPSWPTHPVCTPRWPPPWTIGSVRMGPPLGRHIRG